MADLSRSERDAALVQATLDGALRLARLARSGRRAGGGNARDR